VLITLLSSNANIITPAKVKLILETAKLFLKKSLPQPLRRRGVRTCGKPLPSFGGVGGGFLSPLGRTGVDVKAGVIAADLAI